MDIQQSTKLLYVEASKQNPLLIEKLLGIAPFVDVSTAESVEAGMEMVK